MKRSSSKAGFTLIEILVVMAILATTLSVATFFIGRPAGAVGGDRAAVRSFVQALREAREGAMLSNREQVFRIDLDERTWQAGQNAPTAFPGHWDVTVTTARRERLSDSSSQLRFFPDGSVTGGRVAVTANDVLWLIDIDWMTGRISHSREVDAAG